MSHISGKQQQYFQAPRFLPQSFPLTTGRFPSCQCCRDWWRESWSGFSIRRSLPYQPRMNLPTNLPLGRPAPRPPRSSQCSHVTDMLRCNAYVTVVSMDFSKAFDTVRHATLADKLAKLCIQDNIYNWVITHKVVCLLLLLFSGTAAHHQI